MDMEIPKTVATCSLHEPKTGIGACGYKGEEVHQQETDVWKNKG